jgi:hypothetical protein
MRDRMTSGRTYHAAVVRLADPTGELRPTAARVLKALRTSGPQTTDQLTATLANRGRAIRPATIQVALGELVVADWSPTPARTGSSAGWRCPRSAIRCWRPWTRGAPMTFGTGSRRGWRTPVFQPG